MRSGPISRLPQAPTAEEPLGQEYAGLVELILGADGGTIGEVDILVAVLGRFDSMRNR